MKAIVHQKYDSSDILELKLLRFINDIYKILNS